MTIHHLPDAPWRHRPGFKELCAALGVDTDQIRIVGGAVRDGLLGVDVSDIDLATLHAPAEVMQRLADAGIKTFPTGIDHGTVTAVIGDRSPVEITTLRRDVSTDGRRATIAYTDNWQEDAARRDFTMNALYASPQSGEIFDYFGGLEDLSARRVRFIGDATARIAEDHLRILRYFRFLARFGALPPDDTAYAACVDQANSLMALSRERIADEILKLLSLPDPSAVLALMIEGRIFRPILPEIDTSGLERLRRLIAREQECGFTPDAPLRLAALLPPYAETAEKVAARLKLSNKMRKRMTAALTPPPSARSLEELAFRISMEGAIDHLLLDDSISAQKIAHLKIWEMPEFPVKGKDLIALGITPGPIVAQLLNSVREKWIAAGFPSQAAAHQIAEEVVSDALRDNQ